MYKVKILNNIKSPELAKFDKSKYDVSAEITNPEAIMVRSAKLHDEVFNPELLCIARAGAGVNTIPIDRCADEGIIVFNTPGANAGGVKELAICAMLLASRDIIGGVEWARSVASEGDEVAALVEKQKAQFGGTEILGKKLGVIGLGAIGAKIAEAANALGMKVTGYDPHLSIEAAAQLSPDIKKIDDLDAIYKESDFISLNLPYMEATKHIINKATIAKMKQGVRLINMARAELVNDDDLLEALGSGQVACYVTDFPNGKTAGAKGVIPVPHLGASTEESEDNCVAMAAAEIIEYVENGNIVNSVNMAGAFLPRNGDPRICIIHNNIPEMINKITSVISSRGINIENMVNAGAKGKAHMYTMIDVASLPDGIADELAGIEGITRIRILP